MTANLVKECNKKQEKNVFVVDNFYSDPMVLRKRILKLDFDVVGPFPGRRTRSIWQLGWSDYQDGGNSLKTKIESIILEPIIAWPANSSNGSFQLCTAADKPTIHTDPCWVGVVYLSHNADPSSGTSFFEPEFETAGSNRPVDRQANAPQLKKYKEVSNIFNRALIFHGSIFHCQTNVFGADTRSARLSQVFFFGTESCGAVLKKLLGDRS